MHPIGIPSIVFLAYLLLFLPWLAIRSARKLHALRASGATRAIPSRFAIWIGTLIGLVLLFGLSWLAASYFGFRLFAMPRLGIPEILAALAAFISHMALRAIVRRTRTEAERRTLMVYKIAPRVPREWLVFVLVCVMAGISEESAYRGVGFAILSYGLGNPGIAVLILATAFTVAHWSQGLKSGIVIFVIALVMHALVLYTRTLVLAMIVHAVYDLVAGARIARDAPRYDVAPETPAAAG